jgi:hypothetical protein
MISFSLASLSNLMPYDSDSRDEDDGSHVSNACMLSVGGRGCASCRWWVLREPYVCLGLER